LNRGLTLIIAVASLRDRYLQVLLRFIFGHYGCHVVHL
jgi:hypothetical protein